MFQIKTFSESRFYVAQPAAIADGSVRFVEHTPADRQSISIDEQVKAWVAETGKVIVNPGQLSFHTYWISAGDNPYAIKCVLVGLSILYQD